MKKKTWLTPTVVALGTVSLLTDISGEMVVPLLPAFITTVLGGGAIAIGFMDGMAELVNSILQVVAGRRVDRTGKRKALVLTGYGLSGLIRPLMGFAMVPWHAILVRISDRVGKGLRSTPRDHLLAQESDPSTRGRVYGFHRAMDHTGAVLGPLVAVGLLSAFDGNLRWVFWCAAVPGALAFLVIIFAVKEKPSPAFKAKAKPEAWHWLPPREVRPLLLAMGVFSLGASSDMFLLLKAGQSNAPLASLPLLWMAFHMVKVGTSLWGGSLADGIGEKRTISLGWVVYALVYGALAFAGDPWVVGALFMVYALYHGFTEGPEKALITRMAKLKDRGAALGWYGLTTGLMVLPASLFFGWLYDAVSPKAAFLSGSAFALLGLLFLQTLPDRKTV